MERPILSLVTGTLNRKPHFDRLVKSIVERTPMPWELIVSDASDEPYSGDYPEQVKFIPERPRLGCVKGYNKAFSRATGQWVMWLNDDAEVMPGYANAAIQWMHGHRDAGVGCLYYAESCLPYRINEYKRMIYPNFGIMDRELGERLGWMDPVVTMYGNDNSIAFRVLLAGLGIGSIQGARIWHHVIMDEYKIDNQKHRVADATNLMAKYGPFLPDMERVYKRHAHLVGPMEIRD